MSPETRSFVIIAALALAVVIVILIIQPLPSEDSKFKDQWPKKVEWGQSIKALDCRINGSLPDSRCTPGDIIPQNTKEVICDPAFRSWLFRDSSTSRAEKREVYKMYGIPRPFNNRGRNQMCEIDHLVPLELGGADTMANLWPQCSLGYSDWEGTDFHDKDHFE